MHALNIGDNAPDFTLFTSEKEPFTLSSLQGRPVIILFFPVAFTSVCTTELCAVRDNIAQYNPFDAQVVAISVDSVYTLKVYKEAQGLNFPLLSDFNKEVSTAYGALYEKFAFEMKGVSKRAAFVIDPAGKIAYAEVLENAGELPDFDAIVSTLSLVSA